jgi:hypothetical protein
MDSHYALLPLLSSLVYMNAGSDGWLKWLPLLVGVLLPLLPTLQTTFHGCTCWRNFFKSKHLEYQASLKVRSWEMEPDSIVRQFAVVFWEWNRLNETVGCKRVVEEAVGSRYWDETALRDGNGIPLFIDDASTPFWNRANPDVIYTMWMDRRTNKEGELQGELYLRITFRRADATPKDVVDHIVALRAQSKEILQARQCKPCVLVSTDPNAESRKEEGGSDLAFAKYEFKTTSTFANFFSEEARIVQADLRAFLDGKAAYERTGRPWTYTLLNEGLPGTGKTKLVKAIATMTGRTLIVLNLQHITSVKLLYDAFHSSVLAGDHIPHGKRLYYIPEIDTQQCEQLKQRVFAKQGQTLPLVPVAPSSSLASGTPSLPVAPWVSHAPTKTPPTLGEILNVLDGVPERHGHILVMDTNVLQQLDKALIRPGRVNRILSWGPMTQRDTKELLANHFNTTVPKNLVLPDRVLTAAEVQGLISDAPTIEAAMATVKAAAVAVKAPSTTLASATKNTRTIPTPPFLEINRNEVPSFRRSYKRL